MARRPALTASGDPDRGAEPGARHGGLAIAGWLLLALGVYVVLSRPFAGTERIELTYSEFMAQLESDNVERVHVRGPTITGSLRQAYGSDGDPPEGSSDARQTSSPVSSYTDFRTVAPPFAEEELARRLADANVEISAERDTGSTWIHLLAAALPAVVLVALLVYGVRALRRQAGGFGGAGNPLMMSRSRIRRFDPKSDDVMFDDIAGLEGAKQDLRQVVGFLEDPTRYRELGAKLPRGILLMGRPGTGKTLLARAVAGEAGVPFFSVGGSEFIETFVGVGAARVRSMFEEARRDAPAVVFIDEIDSVGRSRGTGLGGGHDEREQTLNQILSEMDGFAQHEPVLVLAATNRPDVLDPALLRPGRFDRKVVLDPPLRPARRAILEVHTRRARLAPDVDLDAVAASTVGFVGADLENLVNEAALLAGRDGAKEVRAEHFARARDAIVLGREREDLLSDEERQRVAYHEGGHALLALRLPGAEPLRMVTIVPRGHALGATEQLPDEARLNRRRSEIVDRIVVLLGGRAAEQLVFGEPSSGASDDVHQATALARRMVTEFGMGSRLGAASFRYGEQHMFLGKELGTPRQFSEHTARQIDEEILEILRSAETRALETLREHADELETLACTLTERETLDQSEIEKLLAAGRLSASVGDRETR